MKIFSKFALALVCAMFLFATSDAQAQKKTKTKLSKEAKAMLGVWVLDDLDMKLDETKANEEQKQQFAMVQAMMGMFKEKMKGNLSFEFKADGTYVRTMKEDGKTDEEKGTWRREGNKTFVKPEKPKEDTPEFLITSMEGALLKLEAPTKQDMPINVTMKLAKKK